MKETTIHRKKIASVIDIGSIAIRMVIIEIEDDGSYRRLDRVSQPVNIGRDVFINRSISSKSITHIIQILIGFTELLRNWGVSLEQTYVVATSAVRETRNKEIFVDRIKTKTGFLIEILDGVEENHLTYIAVRNAVKNHKTLAGSNYIIMEVGGGTTELMIMFKGRVQTTLSLKLGTLRLEQQFKNKAYTTSTLEKMLLEQIRPSLINLQAEMDLGKIHYFIMIGSDARLTATIIGQERDAHFSTIKPSNFLNWMQDVQKLEGDQIVQKLNISYAQAESLCPTLLIFKIFMEKMSSLKEIIVPDVSIREGILLRNLIGRSATLEQDFTNQVIASTHSLGSRYHIDQKQALKIVEICLNIYDTIANAHGLGNRGRLYLEVAAILHRIGAFIHHSGYHKHGQYIVAHSEIFGLTQEEIETVANVIRYQRGNKPLGSHPQFASLSIKQRLIVMKLAAIIRVATALVQNMYTQNPEMELEHSTLYISGRSSLMSTVLTVAIAFFEDVFGYTIVLR